MLKKLSRPRLLRAALTLAAAFLVSAALLLPVPAEAVCGRYTLTDYFFDAAKTQYAGSCARSCNGAYNCWGTITPYKIIESEPCGC